MKWKVGQKIKIHHAFMPGGMRKEEDYISSSTLEKKRTHFGKIVVVNDMYVGVKWNDFVHIQIYLHGTYVINHIYLISELPKNNPNRTFVEENAYGNKI